MSELAVRGFSAHGQRVAAPSPRVSVVMPVFNGERYIAEAVRSVLASSFGDLELLIVDDGSTDGSVSEALRGAAGDSRLRIIELAHGGVAAARNAGLHAARGELIANQDADDVMFPERLSRQVAYLDGHPECVAVGSRVLMTNALGRPVRIGISAFSHEEIEAENLDGRVGMGNPTVMFRRETVLALGGYETHLTATGEDYDLSLRLGEVGRLATLPDVLIRYRLHDANVSIAGTSLERRTEIRLATLARAYARRGITSRTPAIGRQPPAPAWARWCDGALLRYYAGDRLGAVAPALAAWTRQPTSPATRAALRTILRAPPPMPDAPAISDAMSAHTSSMGGFLATFLGAVGVFLLCALLVIGTINPLGGFWGTRFPTTIPATRSQKEALFAAQNREAPVEGLILGSSRSMKLDPVDFSKGTGHRFFNFAVSTGGLADAKAIIDFAADRHTPLHEIVLGVDPTMLAHFSTPQELTDDWELGPRAEGRRPTLLWRIGHGLRLFKQALSLAYVHEMLTSIRAKRDGREPLHTFLSDGYLEYRSRDRSIARGTYNRAGAIAGCIRDYADSLTASHQFDPARVALLRSTLDDARAHGIAVTLWLTPWHPAFYRAISNRPDVIAYMRAVPDTLARIAAERGVPFVSLPTLQDFNGDPTDWYDCVHYGNGNAKRIANLINSARSTTQSRVARVPEDRR